MQVSTVRQLSSWQMVLYAVLIEALESLPKVCMA